MRKLMIVLAASAALAVPTPATIATTDSDLARSVRPQNPDRRRRHHPGPSRRDAGKRGEVLSILEYRR